MTALTLGEATAAAVAAILADRVEIAPDAILPLLPDHIINARPSKQAINKAVAAAGWRRVALREGGTVFRAPQAVSDPLVRRGEAGDNISAEQLRLFIERIERLEEEKKGIADDIKDVYGEATSTGFDAKTMRAIVKLRKMEKHHRDEAEAMLDLYKSVMGLN